MKSSDFLEIKVIKPKWSDLQALEESCALWEHQQCSILLAQIRARDRCSSQSGKHMTSEGRAAEHVLMIAPSHGLPLQPGCQSATKRLSPPASTSCFSANKSPALKHVDMARVFSNPKRRAQSTPSAAAHHS